MTYASSIRLGMKYRDTDTNFEGVANRITFSRNGTPSVELRALHSGAPVNHWFDSMTLRPVDGEPVGFGVSLSEEALR